MITITEKAALRIQKELNDQNLNNKTNNLPQFLGFRFGIKAGGCSGFEYVFYPLLYPDKYDEVFESNGVKIYVDQKSLKLVDGTNIDYSPGTNLLERFVFNNPKAKTGCGCGNSFELK